MATTVITPAINNLQSVEDTLIDIAKNIIKNNASEIVLLVKGQLSRGLNSSGNPLKWEKGNGFYAKATQSFANRDKVTMPKVFGSPYNFSWSGETLDNLQMGKISEKFYEITTVAYKKQLLEGIYGEIFDLTEEHNNYVNEKILLPELQKIILEEMLKGYL